MICERYDFRPTPTPTLQKALFTQFYPFNTWNGRKNRFYWTTIQRRFENWLFFGFNEGTCCAFTEIVAGEHGVNTRWFYKWVFFHKSIVLFQFDITRGCNGIIILLLQRLVIFAKIKLFEPFSFDIIALIIGRRIPRNYVLDLKQVICACHHLFTASQIQCGLKHGLLKWRCVLLQRHRGLG